MSSPVRRNRFPRRGDPVRRNYYLWAFWSGLLLLLLIAFTDMVLCVVEEEFKPPEVCVSCGWDEKPHIRWGCLGEYDPPNRICPTCGRQWGSYFPYYLQ